MDKLLEKIQQMKETYRSEDVPTITAWEEQLLLLIAKEAIADTEPIKNLLKMLADRIKGIDIRLLESDSKQLSDVDRDRIIDQKIIYKEMIKYFDVLTERKELEDLINEN